jgi:hypothetical protein
LDRLAAISARNGTGSHHFPRQGSRQSWALHYFYNIVLHVSEASVPSTVWRHIFAVMGAIFLAGATFKQFVAEDRS